MCFYAAFAIKLRSLVDLRVGFVQVWSNVSVEIVRVSGIKNGTEFLLGLVTFRWENSSTAGGPAPTGQTHAPTGQGHAPTGQDHAPTGKTPAPTGQVSAEPQDFIVFTNSDRTCKNDPKYESCDLANQQRSERHSQQPNVVGVTFR